MLSYPGLLSLNFYLRFRNYEIRNWLFDPVNYSLECQFLQTLFIFNFTFLHFYSQRSSGRRCWHQGKRAKKLHFLFLMTVVGIIVVVVLQHLLITYISFDLLFYLSFWIFGRRRVSIVGRYVSIIVDFSLH